MNAKNYQNNITARVSPAVAFEALTRHISEWWTRDYEGSAGNEGDEFIVRFGPTFKKLRVSNIIPGKRVEWLCTDQHLEMPPGMEPLKNNSEWIGTTIVWEIVPGESVTKLSHSHLGLTPGVECYAVCEQGWNQTLQSISSFLNTGSGQPFEQLDDEHLAMARQNHSMNSI